MKKTMRLLFGARFKSGISAGYTDGGQATSISSPVATENTEALTEIQEDAHILYSYSYRDALALAGVSSKDINISKEGSKTTYTFTQHVLSCGTHINGEITEVIEGNTKTLVGSFDVTENSYKINDLEINITFNTDTDEKTGYIKINGRL